MRQKRYFLILLCLLFFVPEILQAAPIATASISANSNPKRTEDVILTLTIDNTGDQIGYFPYMRLILPSAASNPLNEDSCGGLGTPQITTASVSPATDPYNSESITLAGGEKVVYIVPPVAQLAPTQPAISCKIRIDVSATNSFNVTNVRSIFAYGNSVNGEARACGGTGATICSGTTSVTVSPRYAHISTTATPLTPSGTGPQSPISVNTAVDVASGLTLNNVVITDVLPDSFVISDPGNCSQVTVVPAPTSCSFTPNAGAANGGTLQVNYTTLAVDASITYNGYIRRLGDSGAAIVNAATGAKTTSQNTVSMNSTQTGVITPTAAAVFNQRSIHASKSVAVVAEFAGGKASFSPGDTVEWTMAIAISDYFQFENMIIADTIQDGQSFVNNSLSVTVSENTADTVLTEADLEAQAHLAIAAGAGGTTTINLDLGSAMADGFFSFSDDVLSGANSFGGANRATKVTIRYRTIISESFVAGGGSVDTGDGISDILNSVTTNIVGQGANYNFGAELPLTTTATIVPIATYTKALTHINNLAVGAAPYHIDAGDLAVFRMRITIPDGGGESFRIEDYLPGPIFNPPGGCFAYAAAAPTALASGQWTFGTNTPGIAAGGVTVTCDATNDKVQFDFPDFNLAAGTSDAVLEIYLAVDAQTDPSEDGFEFANSSFLSYQTSTGATVATLTAAAGFISDTPDVTMDLYDITLTDDASGVITTGNLTGVDSGALVTLQTNLTNGGVGTAQDGVLTVTLPAGYEAPSNPTACTEGGAPDCQYVVTPSVGCGGATVAAASDQTQVLVSNIDIAQGATCTITHRLRIALSAQPAQVMTTEARFTWTNGGTSFSPQFSSATTTLRSPAITVTSVTAPAQTRPGDDIDARVTMTVPDGTSNGFYATIVDSSFVTFDATSNATVSLALSPQVINATTYYCTVASASFMNNICFANDPNLAINLSIVGGNLRINFGQVINGYADNTNQTVVFDVLSGIIDAAATAGAKTIRADYTWNNPNAAGTLTVSSANSALTVYRPALTVTKCASTATSTAAPIAMNETVTYNILVANTGSNLETAFDVANIPDSLTSGTTYVNASVSAYYCTSGASTKSCTDWNPAAAGCTAVAPVPAGNVNIPVVNSSGNPDIVANGYYHVAITADINCENVADTSGLDLAPTHPDNDGINNACVDPVLAFANNLNNSIASFAYSSQDGAGPNGVEGSYATSASNTTALALDMDGDGITNSIEGSGDADGDGVPNYLDTDSDDNGILDATEAGNLATPVDTDGDGVPNYRDSDDDGDGINDSQEITDRGGTGTDTDGDGVVDFRDPDSDNDGVSDFADGHLTNTDGAADGQNAFDQDSDNDGIPDLFEHGLGSCDNGTGAGNPNDGVLHRDEILACNVASCTGGTCDDDANGGIEADEFVGGVLPDRDGDGIPNYRDLDSDNDGLPDFYENLLGQITLAAVNSLDANSNGFIEGTTTPGPLAGELKNLGDAIGNTNGIVENSEILDTDADGAPNFIDTDSDSDGVPDIVENNRYTLDTDGDNIIDYGVALEFDNTADTNLIGPNNQTLIDTDSDGVYNFIDTDSDGDGVHDWIEAWSTNIDTGTVNGRISSSEFSAAVITVGNSDTYFAFTELVDTDTDGNPDIFDLDSDGDTILDQHESDSADLNAATIVSLYANLRNADGDAARSFRDLDSDGDTFTDAVEAGDGVVATVPVDTDADGTADFEDTDSDADGLDDEDEPTAGTSRTNNDSDGDAVRDGCEIYGDAYAGPGVCSYSGKPWSFNGTLVAPVTDPLDADTDDGGTSDGVEAATAGNPNPRAGNGADDPFQSDDPDSDGLINAQELLAGSNYTIADTDGDGLNDGIEVLTYNTSPINVDTDGGGVQDGVEVAISMNPLDPADDDTDGDGLPNQFEDSIGLDRTRDDTNGDCISDDDEVGPNLSSPYDRDGDGVIDALDPDNDNDGLLDCEEVHQGANPNTSDIKVRGGGGGGCGLIKGGPRIPPFRGLMMLLPFAFVLLFALFLRERPRFSRARVSKFGVGIAIFLTGGSARALDSQLFRQQILADGSQSLYGTNSGQEGNFNFGVSYIYTRNPLTFGKEGETDKFDDIVNSLHTIEFQGAYQFSERLALILNAPIQYLSTFEAAQSSAQSQKSALGDLQVSAQYSIHDRRETKFGLGILPYVVLPTGPEGQYVGASATNFGLKLLADYQLSPSTYVLTNLGYLNRKKESVFALEIGSAMTYGLGVVHALNSTHMKELMVEVAGERPIGVTGTPENTPVELLLGIRSYMSDKFRWDINLGRGLTAGYGAPEARLVLSLTWGPGRTEYVPPVVAEAPPPQAPTPKKLDVPVKIKVDRIYFSKGKTDIKKESHRTLNALIETLKTYPEIAKVRVEGHTDNSGEAEKNMMLSRGRAEAVYKYLVEGGIAAERLEYEGFGPDQPLTSNDTEEGRSTNRRVEFKILEITGDLNRLLPATE